MDQPGRVAVVAGASRGVGKGVALELGAVGLTVFVIGRSVTPGRLPGTVVETAAAVDDLGGRGVPVACDFRDDAAVSALFERVRDEAGRLDVVVNCVYDAAGSARWLGRPFWEVPPSAWDGGFAGVRSYDVTAHLAAPLLVESDHGLLVAISSPGAVRYLHNAVYGVGKAAVDRLTADLAHDLCDTPATAVSLWPGPVRTELLDLVPAGPDGRRLVALPGEEPFDVDGAESPRFAGRAVAALAGDPGAGRWSGRAVAVADLAAHYGFRDVDGRRPGPAH